MGVGDLDGVGPAPGLEHLVPVLLERVPNELANGVLVLHQQDRLGGPGGPDGTAGATAAGSGGRAAVGRRVHFVGVQADPTARRNLDDQLCQARRTEAVGRLTGSVAHAFNNRITVQELGQGTGQGPASVYGIVKQSGGHGVVDSEPSVRTTYRVLLPRAEKPLEGA